MTSSNDYIKKELLKWRSFYISKIKPIDLKKIKNTNNCQISLPVRLNLSAGWNDTPPYSNENKGSTLNMSFLLNNKKPITACIKKIKTNSIILESEGSKKETITNIDQLLDCFSPNKNNALLKASILASGLIPIDNTLDLNVLLNKTGGFKIKTKTKNIPIGSGLGTSSIIITAVVKTIYKYFNLQITDTELFKIVAIAEQIMSTGGGYQDQIGAYIKGVKLIEFIPKKDDFPNFKIKQIKLSNKTKKYLNDNLKIIYTGKTRLAKNILETIMGNYIVKNENTISILKEIDIVAKQMKKNLEDDNLEQFGKNMIKSYELCKAMYSFSNNEIEEIINKIKDKCFGYMIAGAGGGGFLIVLYKEH